MPASSVPRAMNGSASCDAAAVEEHVAEGEEGDGALGVVGQPGLLGQIEDCPAVGLGVGGASFQAVDLGQMATGDDVHDGHGPVAGDEVEGGTEGLAGLVELAGGHPAAADDEEQTGACPRLIGWYEVEGGLGGPQGVVGVTESDQPSRFEQGQLGFHERSVNVGRGIGLGVAEGFDQVVDVVPATGMVRVPGSGEGEARVSSEHVTREELRPFAQGLLPALPDQDPSLAVDELGAAVGFAGGDVVADGVAGHVVVGEPVGGAAVTRARVIAALQAEPVGEQMVVAEPLASMVERDDEQVAAGRARRAGPGRRRRR